MKNTKQKGILHFLIYREKNSKEYIALCLELGLIEVSENPDYLKESIIRAAKGYVHTVVKEDMSDDLLNAKPSKENMELYQNALEVLKISEESGKRKTLEDVLIFRTNINRDLVNA